MEYKNFLATVVEEFNGCPWLTDGNPEKREKGDLDELDGKVVMIEDYYKMSDYHAVIFKGNPKVYLSGGSLKELLNKYGDEEKPNITQLRIEMLPKREFKDKSTNTPKSYRPIRIVV